MLSWNYSNCLVSIYIAICPLFLLYLESFYSRKDWKRSLPVLCFGKTIQSSGEGNGNPLQHSCLENPVGRWAWWAAVHRVAQSRTRLKRLCMHACIGEGNGNPPSVLAWRIPGTGEPGGLPSMGSHRVGHDWSNLAAAVFNHHLVLKVRHCWMGRSTASIVWLFSSCHYYYRK